MNKHWRDSSVWVKAFMHFEHSRVRPLLLLFLILLFFEFLTKATLVRLLVFNNPDPVQCTAAIGSITCENDAWIKLHRFASIYVVASYSVFLTRFSPTDNIICSSSCFACLPVNMSDKSNEHVNRNICKEIM